MKRKVFSGTSGMRHTLTNLSRASGGALFFSLPLLMTMEMWQAGSALDGFRLALFLVLFVPILVRLNYQAGFEKVSGLPSYVRNAFSAFAVGFLITGLVLALIGQLTPGAGLRELAGKIAVQAAPASIGATLAASQFGERKARAKGRSRVQHYEGELFLMGTGALFFAFNLAPTEEIPLLAYRMTGAQVVLIALVSFVLVDIIVYRLEFRRHGAGSEGRPGWKPFLFYSLTGYSLALLVSAWILWTFGRFDGQGMMNAVKMTAILGFPAALGAAGARLIM